MEDNPFAGAKAKRKVGAEGGQPKHTIKYYLWQLLQEAGGAGMTADELVHQLESRSLRSFAGNKKASSQVQVELSRGKKHFCIDSEAKRWSLIRQHPAKAEPEAPAHAEPANMQQSDEAPAEPDTQADAGTATNPAGEALPPVDDQQPAVSSADAPHEEGEQYHAEDRHAPQPPEQEEPCSPAREHGDADRRSAPTGNAAAQDVEQEAPTAAIAMPETEPTDISEADPRMHEVPDATARLPAATAPHPVQKEPSLLELQATRPVGLAEAESTPRSAEPGLQPANLQLRQPPEPASKPAAEPSAEHAESAHDAGQSTKEALIAQDAAADCSSSRGDALASSQALSEIAREASCPAKELSALPAQSGKHEEEACYHPECAHLPLPGAASVRWLPEAAWTQPEQGSAAAIDAHHPTPLLLHLLPEWPHPTLCPPTPPRDAAATGSSIAQAAPAAAQSTPFRPHAAPAAAPVGLLMDDEAHALPPLALPSAMATPQPQLLHAQMPPSTYLASQAGAEPWPASSQQPPRGAQQPGAGGALPPAAAEDLMARIRADVEAQAAQAQQRAAELRAKVAARLEQVNWQQGQEAAARESDSQRHRSRDDAKGTVVERQGSAQEDSKDLNRRQGSGRSLQGELEDAAAKDRKRGREASEAQPQDHRAAAAKQQRRSEDGGQAGAARREERSRSREEERRQPRGGVPDEEELRRRRAKRVQLQETYRQQLQQQQRTGPEKGAGAQGAESREGTREKSPGARPRPSGSRSREPSAHVEWRREDERNREPQSKEQSARKEGRAVGRRLSAEEDKWPFDEGRILACSDATEAAQLRELRFGADAPRALEGMGARTMAFLWNLDRRRLHGIFRGAGRPARETPRDAPYLFEARAPRLTWQQLQAAHMLQDVRVENFEDCRSLSLEEVEALGLGLRNGCTARQQPLLKLRLDRRETARLCTIFASRVRKR